MVVENHQFLRVSSAAEVRDFNLIGVSLTKPLRQHMAVQRRRPGDQRAQQRHFPGGEVAAVITALDRAGHAGAMSSRLRSSLIDHGSHGDRSSGGLRSFSAHAASHVSSQLRMSMPFIESVPTCPSYKFRPAQKSGPFRVVPDSVCDPHTILRHGVLSAFAVAPMR